MTDDQFRRALQSIGMTAFVTHLALFESARSNAEVAGILEQAEGWTAKACKSRTSHARRLLHADRRAEALRLIAASRLPEQVRAAARAAL